MANPNIINNSSTRFDLLIDTQLASGDNDFTATSGTVWMFHSLSICNTSASSVTLNVSMVRPAATPRKIVHNEVIAAGDTLVIDDDVIPLLPDTAKLRFTASAGSALDVVALGSVSA